MPILSLFYGIIIRMYDENGEPHHTPHIHAEYQGQEASFDIDGNMLSGSIPKKQRKLVEAWIAINEEDLRANWELLQKGQGYFKIKPLQ